jgi:hypothetical protein
VTPEIEKALKELAGNLEFYIYEEDYLSYLTEHLAPLLEAGQVMRYMCGKKSKAPWATRWDAALAKLTGKGG